MPSNNEKETIMQVEIKERDAAYEAPAGNAVRWRNGTLEDKRTTGWAKSYIHDDFIAGEITLCDPLNVNVEVVAPQPEREYSLGTIQMLVALELNPEKQYEYDGDGADFVEMVDGAIRWNDGSPLVLAEDVMELNWRERKCKS